ncbi:helix-turn-helix domain-containing protein [Nocardia sp. NPDC050799]|uniref:TetR/AcrR family transcriptional regulator n=1 Tax=Nocardia sp. NPDC050799 TaxID=3154842 RepID=UPI0033D016D5
MRSHARRNYDQILQAATMVFADSGPDASLNEIARRAGVGPGTLYRHFPNRQSLQTAVLRERVEKLCGEGADLLRLPDADLALMRWLSSLLLHARSDKGLGAAALTGTTEQGAQCRTAIVETAAHLVARAKDSGTVRSDTSADDLVHLVAGIGLTTEHQSDSAQAERLLDTVLKGIGMLAISGRGSESPRQAGAATERSACGSAPRVPR